MRRSFVLAGLVAAVAALLRRRRAGAQAERDLWTEATAAPDLR
ncbi:MAG TPA: DLW-39 family protein [Mycobacteriales bacterium]|nr:DLW-39 family protein [Mycobacteriales bacterium]